MENYLNIFKKFVVLTLVVFLTACGGGSTSSNPSDSQQSLRLTVNQAVNINGARIKVSLYGYDEILADVSATLISTSVLNISQLPTTIDFNWPKNAAQLIIPPVSNSSNAKYFLGLAVDVNDDGLICAGDYIEDFNNNSSTGLTGPSSSPITIQLQETSSTFCAPF